MKLSPVIAALKARIPQFEGRIAGAAEFAKIPEAANLPVPAAYVVPLDDNPEEPMAENSVRQSLTETFAVIVCMSNAADERGQAAITDAVDTWRARLWAALLGWQPEAHYDGIYYAGGALLQKDRARLWYQYEFAAQMEIGPEDGWQQPYINSLPDLETLHVDVDVIDPMADANLQYPGPDGRIEFSTDLTLPE